MTVHLQLLLIFSIICFSQCILGYLHEHLADKLCAEGTESRSITLLDNSESAVIFTQQWNVTTNTFFDCQFVLFSNRDAYRIPRGTYIVITDLRFRRDPITQKCMDYIQFENLDFDSVPSEPICGDTMRDETKMNLMLDHSSRDTIIKIHVNNSAPLTAPLELRMVITAHSQCNHKNDLLCDPNVPYSCISRHFVQDNITNCGAPCRDETKCFKERKVNELATVRDSRKVETNAGGESKGNDFHNNRFSPRFNTMEEDDKKCITTNILEEKLKEQTEILQNYISQKDKSVLENFEKVNENLVPPYGELDSQCATKGFVQSELANNLRETLDAIENLIEEYKEDYKKLSQKIRNLERY